MLTASARPDPNAPFARAEITVRGLPASPSSPAFQLRRSNVDYVEPNLDLTGWTRAEVVLLPMDAWWADGGLHLLVSGLLCQFIDPGPLKLRLTGAGGAEIDLFWPEDISVYDDGNLAAHARVLTDTVRVVGPVPAAAVPPAPPPVPPPAPPPPAPPPPAPLTAEAAPSPWTLPPHAGPAVAPISRPRRWRRAWPVLFPLVIGAVVIGAVASRHERVPRSVAPARSGSGGITVQPRAPEDTPGAMRAPADMPGTMRAALDRVMGELTSARRADFDPFLALRPPGEIISRTSTPEGLLRYGATKLDQREPANADRLFEEATRPRFGPGQNRPYAPAFVARGLLYDPSVQHDMILPVPNEAFAETLYRRAMGSGDAAAAAYASRYLQHLLAWEAQH